MADYRPSDANWITRTYMDSLLVETRLMGSDLPSTRYSLFGHEFDTPVMTAALSHLQKVHPDGIAGMAQAAADCNAVMWCGMGDEEELEAIVATGAKTIKIIKPYADEALLESRIRHAEKCGCLALGIDIDHAFNGSGGYDHVLGFDMTPKSLDRLLELRKMTSLPFVIKGVLSKADALACVELGMDGIVVSHHHGMTPFAVPPALVLPEIRDAVKGKLTIFADCCVEDGVDVFKLMACGAESVSVGRRLMEDLRAAGAEGVRRGIESITGQLAMMMAKTGASTVDAIDPTVIHRFSV